MTRYTFFALAFFLLPGYTQAATLTLTQDPLQVGKGDVVEVTLSAESSALLNSFAGTLQYPQNLFEVIAVNDGNSIVSLWLTHPSVEVLSFAGFTPGGFRGSGGKLFSVLFRARAAGSAALSLEDIQLLRNDGEGTAESTTAKPLVITVGATPLGLYHEASDTVPPESFTVALGTDTDLFGGKHYVAFSTVDKGTGVAHYEVSESRIPFFAGAWKTTESPYALSDQHLTSDILVKAVDRAGNERVGVLHRSRLLRPYEWLVLVCILALGLLLRWYIRR